MVLAEIKTSMNVRFENVENERPSFVDYAASHRAYTPYVSRMASIETLAAAERRGFGSAPDTEGGRPDAVPAFCFLVDHVQ
jgi:hypothetical protein